MMMMMFFILIIMLSCYCIYSFHIPVLRFGYYRSHHHHSYTTKDTTFRRDCANVAYDDNGNDISNTERVASNDIDIINHHTSSLNDNVIITLEAADDDVEENDIDSNDISDTIIDDELVNIDLLGENENDQQLLVIQNMINEDLKKDQAVLSPVEIFQSLYRDLKQRNRQNSSSSDNDDASARSPVLSSEEMLSRIYTDAQRPDPFDDVRL